MTTARTAAVIACAGALGACTAYVPPRLAVTGVRTTDVSDDGVLLAFDVEATNTNPVDLPVKELSYRVLIDGREVFRGERSPERTLQRFAIQQFSFPAAIPRSRALAAPAPYVVEGQISYLEPGKINELFYKEGVLRPSAAFRSEGTLDLASPAPKP